MKRKSSFLRRARLRLASALPPSPWTRELREAGVRGGLLREIFLSLSAVLVCLFLELFFSGIYLFFLLSARLAPLLENLPAGGLPPEQLAPLLRQEFTLALASNSYSLFALTSASLAMVGALFYWRRLRRRSYSSLGLVTDGVGREYLLGSLFGALMLGSVLLLGLVFRALSFDPSPAAPISPTLLFAFVVGQAIYGFSQQLLYRGVVLSSLARHRSLPVAVGGSALIYALFHIGQAGITPLGLLNLFLFGVFSAVYALRRGSLFGAAGLQTAWNLMQNNIFSTSAAGEPGTDSLFHLRLATGRPLLSGGASGLEGGLLVSFVLLFFTVLICIIPTAREHGEEKTPENPGN